MVHSARIKLRADRRNITTCDALLQLLLLLLRVMLQPVERACFLCERLLQVRYEHARILDLLAQALDARLDEAE